MRTRTTPREQAERLRRRLALLAHPPGTDPPELDEPGYPTDLPPPRKATVAVVECDAVPAGSTPSEAAHPQTDPADPDHPLTVTALPRRVLAAAALGVLVLAGLVAWWSWPRPEPVAAPVEATVSPQPTAAVLIVSVAGEVRRPGLVEVPAGSRVADAIEAAGGVPDPADLGLLNLARKVVDGELIIVGQAAAGGDQAAASGQGTAPVNLNAATVNELDTLPGVGPVLAQRILDYRDANGGFATVDELREVDGIGAARFAELKDAVTV